MGNAFAMTAKAEELDLVYRLYSITAEAMDKFVTLDYHSFIDNYKESGLSIERYYQKCLADLENNESLSVMRERDKEAQALHQQYMEDSRWFEKVWQYRHLAPPLFFISFLQK